MADITTSLESTTPGAGTNRPLLSALTRWWAPAADASEVEAMLGYESAHPWALADDAAGAAGHVDPAY